MIQKRITFIFLFFFSILIGIVSYTNTHITSLGVIDSLERKNVPITQHTSYTGSFVALFDQLGTIRIRLRTGGRINTNTLIFRLREEGKTEWLVENTYKTDRFHDGQLYPFGFPTIQNSKGKVYEYEIVSPDGDSDNTVTLQLGMFSFQSDYNYSLRQLQSDATLGTWFIKQKVKEMFSTMFHIAYWLMCFIPLFLFVASSKKTYKSIIHVVLLVYLFLYYIFSPLTIHTNFPLYIGVIFYVVSVTENRRHWPFVFSLFALFVFVLSVLMNRYDYAIRAGYVIWVLFAAGTFSSITHND